MTPSDYQLIQGEIQPYLTGTRTESAALLAWFLEVAWRIEPEDIDDAICDGPGDKGIDGLLVDDDLTEITVLQAKHKVDETGTQGDSDLRSLVGAAAYFASSSGIEGLLASRPNLELTRLLNRLQIRDKVAAGAHATRLVFVTDGRLDAAGQSFLPIAASGDQPLEVWDQARLAAVARRTHRPELLSDTVTLDAVAPPSVVHSGGEAQLAVGIVPALQLIKLSGLADLSLFARNVRLSEGRTRINRELGQTIDNAPEHELFMAYHNGLTVLTHGLSVIDTKLTLSGITVVNGCQSLLTLYEH